MKEQSILLEKDRNTVLHPFTHLQKMIDKEIDPKLVIKGEGIYITTGDGKKYLDGFAGLYCMNLGYGRKDIAEAIYRQVQNLAYYHTYVGYSHEALCELSARLMDILPKSIGKGKIFYGLSGSDANETNVKNIWYYHNLIGKPKKKKLIATERGYHGSSIVSGSLTGLPFYHDHMDLPLPMVLRFPGPNYYSGKEEGENQEEFSLRRARELEEFIIANDPDTIGAFFAEPVQGTGGIVPPPEGYWKAIQPILKKYDILIVADEVVTGFGRTGKMFGSDKYGIEPDMMTLAKGLTSAYAPLSASVICEPIAKVFYEAAKKVGAYSHGYTYSGHPVGTAAGLEVLKILEREQIVDQVAKKGDYFQSRMREVFSSYEIVGDVRGVGLIAVIEFISPKIGDLWAPKIAAEILKNGLIGRALPNGDMLGFSPPLIISKEEIDILINTTEEAMKKICR